MPPALDRCELPLLFGSRHWAGAPMLGSAPNAVDEDLARRVRGYWSTFAHAGVDGLGMASIRL
ncbi:hypothetical protein ACQ856_23875 [Mycolicibacterium psychrotolerans]|uniref:hypothetical protein n=1 Tax=Mycolicibacterium psychrotolerans TaxID=216929 RepID=UPI003D679C3B